jgi:hypothetical protein
MAGFLNQAVMSLLLLHQQHCHFAKQKGLAVLLNQQHPVCLAELTRD